eukprot:Hpha_TRINITY_DN17026_c9_g1::TRINITY_DN17026_c9_g1_i5::g.166562::m.166562
MGSTCSKSKRELQSSTVKVMPVAVRRREPFKSWAMDSVGSVMKKEKLEELSGTAEGREQLQKLKEKLDQCVEWCNKYDEDEGTHAGSPQASAAEDGGGEASKEKHEEFQMGLEGMAARAEKLRKMGATSERLIQFTDDTVPSSLLEFIKTLPPTLGYVTPKHVANLATTIRRVVAGAGKRVGERDNLAAFLTCGWFRKEVELNPGLMALAREGPYEGFELLLAGILYTADLTDKDNKSIWINNPSLKRDPTPREEEILGNHGIFKKISTFMSTKLALYFVMNAAMREAPKYLEAGEDSIFTCATKPPQFHVLQTFQPLIKRTAELVRLLPSQETIVFRGIKTNVSTHYHVGSTVVWNAFTS